MENATFEDHPIILKLQELFKMINTAYSGIQAVTFKTSKTEKKLTLQDLQNDWSSSKVKRHFYYQYYNKHFLWPCTSTKGPLH